MVRFHPTPLSLLPLLFANCGAADPGAAEEATVLYENHPGALPYLEALRDQLAGGLAARGEGYEPRTHHLTEDGREAFITYRQKMSEVFDNLPE